MLVAFSTANRFPPESSRGRLSPENAPKCVQGNVSMGLAAASSLDRPLSSSGGALTDSVFLRLVALLDQRPHPERHHAPPRPRLRSIFWIAVFWRDLSAAQRMGPSLRRQFGLLGQTSEPVQFVLEISLYDRCHACDQTVHFLTQIYQFIECHGFWAFHTRSPELRCYVIINQEKLTTYNNARNTHYTT